MDFLSFLMSLGFLRGQGGGGSGGTTNYNALNNKPALNGTTLSGSKTGADYGLVDAEAGKGLSANDYTDADKNKLADLAGIKTIGAGLELEANGNLKATGAEIEAVPLDEVKAWFEQDGKDAFIVYISSHMSDEGDSAKYRAWDADPMTGPANRYNYVHVAPVAEDEKRLRLIYDGAEIAYDPIDWTKYDKAAYADVPFTGKLNGETYSFAFCAGSMNTAVGTPYLALKATKQ